MAKNELAVIENAETLLPSQKEINDIFADLDDLIGPRMLGVATIAAGGAGVFKIREPGEDEASGAGNEIEGVIVANHPVNLRWGHNFGEREDGEAPVCKSMDGVTGISEHGEVIKCATCPHNQYDAATGRKSCDNKRQLYILRKGDLLPMLLAISPSGLKAFDNYRILTRLTLKKPLMQVVTKIGLKNARNRNGISYSAPVFTPAAALDAETAERLQAYGAAIMARMQAARMTADETEASDRSAPPAGFVEVCPDDLPFQ